MIRILCGYYKNQLPKIVTSYPFSTSVNQRDNLTETKQAKTSYNSVTDFYAGKSVFLTGATGFIGRILIERLLYNCKDIKNIYVLIREKKDASIHQRLQELLKNPVFTKLKKTRPQDLNKIVPIAGDVSDFKLGMNQNDEQRVINEVSVIFHSAANVAFLSPLRDLMHANYEGAKNVLDLGKKVKNLDIFVYISTAFHNANLVIDEFPHSPPRTIEEVYRATNNNDPDEIRKLLDKRGNKYVFSKNMSEAYIASNYEHMPTIIVRPSMVTSIYKDPLVGYNDCWVIGTSLLCDIASGLTRYVRGDKEVVVDIIPADYVSNFLIVAAAKNAKTKKFNVYNIGTGHNNPIDWETLVDIYLKESKKHHDEVMPYPWVYFTKAAWAIPVLSFFTQVVPAFAADVWLRLSGSQPKYTKMQKHVLSRTYLSEPVTMKSWDIRTNKAKELLTTMTNEDKQTFPCDPNTINWDKYVPIYCRGVKKYMLKSNVKNK